MIWYYKKYYSYNNYIKSLVIIKTSKFHQLLSYIYFMSQKSLLLLILKQFGLFLLLIFFIYKIFVPDIILFQWFLKFNKSFTTQNGEVKIYAFLAVVFSKFFYVVETIFISFLSIFFILPVKQNFLLSYFSFHILFIIIKIYFCIFLK